MRRLSLLACATALLALPVSAQAEDYQAVTFLPPSNLLTSGPLIEWSKDVAAATDGRIAFNVHSGGALLGANTILTGLGDDVAQVGFVAASYYPKDLPKTNAVDDLSFIHTQSLPLAFAFTEFVMTTPEVREEWEDNGLVFIAGMNTPPYQLFCRSAVETAGDVKGKKIRTPGAVLARWAQFMGAVPVNAPLSEAYTGLERGVLDCVVADNTTLVSTRLMEVASHVVELDLGSYFLGSPWSLSRDFWTGLSVEDRQVLLDLTARALVKLQIAYAKNLESAVGEAKAAGVTFVPSEGEWEAAKQAFIDADMGGSTELVKSQLGVENPELYRERLGSLVAKWKDLLRNVDTLDEDALHALLRSEIYDAIDVRTYGVE
ncbi:C4-dicarboxylate TRAP transporter substrate-binding protein [Arenibaculum sp.]|uniref:C4-dicarboxylate TRAP transporter substrate-binding protein n=1 Tax=Arenibaculum sp. TaxID=2865862 RepID=UPI002E0F5257|nr:C4-dicarboxylate TRAP transporter substrate-binding protein [Arenibaculum sp.]